MLLYVNKKQQRRKRIKLISLILLCVFVVFTNIVYFPKNLHQSDKYLTSYTPITTQHDWFKTSQNIIIFSSKDNFAKNIIIIPTTLNREISLTLAYTLSKIANISALEFTSDVKDKAFINEISYPFLLKQPKQSNKKVLLTTNIDSITQEIYDKKLFPTVINYQQAQKIKTNSQIMSIIDKKFPLQIAPQSTLEKQQLALQKFVDTYYSVLKKLPQIPNYKNLSAHGVFLQNINICLHTNKTKVCSINNNNSFQKNLDNVLKQMPKHSTISKLTLLTSTEKISSDTQLEQNDGLIFKYGLKEEILLPSEIIDIQQKQQNPYIEIKKQAGLNYYYETDDMKFYKFKIVEIDINDKI